MASNIQQGTRGMSAGDWTRLKRLRGARNFEAQKPADITNPLGPHFESKTGRRVYTEFGTPKVRRPASFYTDYRASQTADYIIQSTNSSNLIGKDLAQVWLCDCSRPSTGVLKGNVGVCVKCDTRRTI